MNLQILPLAITMMAGPQIMSAIIFVTASKPVRLSAAFLATVAIAATVGVAIFLAQNNASFLAALPFLAATVLVAALPVLFMPKVRDWMNTHS